jgi:hypothetical protein
MKPVAGLLVALVLATSAVWGQSAADPGPAIRQAIEGQWEALSRDDAEAAYWFATPEIHAMFSADGFLAMVRTGYPMVYRHLSSRFLAPRVLGPFAFQTVKLADATGTVWLVRYTMRLQPDGSWKIGSVRPVPEAPVPALEPEPSGA